MSLLSVLLVATLVLIRNGSIVDMYISFRRWTAPSDLHQVQPKERTRRKQEFVIIASSAESGFDAVEKDLIALSRHYKLSPYSYVIPDISSSNYTKSHGSLPLMEAIRTKSTTVPRGFDTYNITKNNASDFFIMEFQKEFNSLWMQNKNILVGSDSFSDFHDVTLRRKFVDRFVKMFPWNDKRFSLPGSNHDAKVIVLYRSSRIDHLKSLWGNSLGKVAFKDWITSSPHNYRNLDVFSTAEVFSKKGLKVDIVDVDHVVNNNQNLTKYILCEVMELQCQGTGPLKDAIIGYSKPTKLHSGNGNVGGIPIHELETTLNDFDCSFDFLTNAKENVRFFPKSLSEKFLKCKKNTSTPTELAMKLYNVAQKLKSKVK